MIFSSEPFDRRHFLVRSAAATASSLIPYALLGQATSVKPLIPNRDTVLKFNPNGTPRPFKGNTVISHLPAQCKLRDEMVSIHEELMRSSYIHKLGPTSTDSYHMTVYPGANDQDRGVSAWPSYVPIRATIEECNIKVGEKIASAQLECKLPLRMRIDADATLARKTASGLTLAGVDSVEEKKLRSLRNQISALYGLQLPDQDTYRFHMTMSYQIAPFTSQEWASYQTMFSRHVNRIVQEIPVIELGVLEYCTFDDMFRFEPRKMLSCS